jgi:hypothetical protein
LREERTHPFEKLRREEFSLHMTNKIIHFIQLIGVGYFSVNGSRQSLNHNELDLLDKF